MLKLITYKKGFYWDSDSKSYLKERYFEAYTLEKSSSLENFIPRQSVNDFFYHGIDKISFTFSRKFLNEENYKYQYKNGAISVIRHSTSFTVAINREYIPINENLSSFIRNCFKAIVDTGIFQIPTKIATIDLTTAEYKEENFPENKIETEEEFFERIYAMKKLQCIELCFDMHISIRKLLDHKEFTDIEGTLYSTDYKVYESGNRKRSMICIYDKAIEQTERKNRAVYCTLERFELRLFASSFSIMNTAVEKLFNCNYEELVMKLLPWIKKHLSKQNHDFSKLVKALPKEQKLLKLILEN